MKKETDGTPELQVGGMLSDGRKKENFDVVKLKLEMGIIISI